MTKLQNTIGTLAFYDSFAGLIPCKVEQIEDKLHRDSNLRGCSSSCIIRAKLTASRGAYKRGEIIESTALHIVPRNYVRRRKYGARIIGGYRWE